MDLSKRIKSALLNGVTDSVSPEAIAIRSRIAKHNPHVWKRPIWQAINGLSHNHPHLVARSLGLTFVPSTVECIGIGSQSIVIKEDASTVRKVITASLMLSDSERRRQASIAQEQNNALIAHYGELALRHTVVIDSHPFFPDKQAIQLLQPLSSTTSTHVFPSFTHTIAGNIYSLRQSAPRATEQLTSFIDIGRQLYREDGLLPDVIGVSNVVVNDHDALVLVDGQPITHDNERARNAVLAQLDMAERVLQIS